MSRVPRGSRRASCRGTPGKGRCRPAKPRASGSFGLDETVVAVVSLVDHLAAPVLGVDEVEEAVVERVHLPASTLDRDRLGVAAGLRDDDPVLAGERAAPRVQQAEAPVVAAMDDDVLPG